MHPECDERACERASAESRRLDVEDALAGVRRVPGAEDDSERHQVRDREDERDATATAIARGVRRHLATAASTSSGSAVNTNP